MFSAPRDGSPLVGFRRSSYCLDGNCVEVATLHDGDIALRDSKDGSPTTPVLRFSADGWAAFVTGVAAR